MWAVLCTDGELNLDEVRDECVPGKWVPVFVYRTNANDNPIVPLFYDGLTAKNFAKRNMPKKWMRGGIELTRRDVEWMKEKGWIIKEMTFAQRVDKFICGFEILEFAETPEFRNGI